MTATLPEPRESRNMILRLDRIANLLGARPAGDGTWFAADCPVCRTRWALSLTIRSFECRFDGCRWAGVDLRTVVARWMASAGRSRTEIVSVLGEIVT